MSNNQDSANKALYEQQESRLSAESAAFIKLLTKKGILGDQKIDDERVRKAQKDKNRNMYHNTLLLLQHYRNIIWALECFPANVAEELDQPLGDLDELLDRMDIELSMNNRKLESRMESIRRSRILLDRVNEALSILKRKPENGQKLYDLIYLTYIVPEKLSHTDLVYRLDMSSRNYYRFRQQAINILSIRLWSAPAGEVDAWLEVLTLLESL